MLLYRKIQRVTGTKKAIILYTITAMFIPAAVSAYLLISRRIFSDMLFLFGWLIILCEAIILGIPVFILSAIISRKNLKETYYRQVITKLREADATDGLTRLYNRSFAETCLETELEESFLFNRQTSIIIMDIDNFKEVSDTCGHPMVDRTLAFLSELVLKCVRKSDYAARYGGDEFIVILPSTDAETAAAIAERIRSAVGSSSIPGCEHNGNVHLGCSLGVSSFPLHAGSREELVKAAGSALYMAKQDGKNCVRVYKKYTA